MFKPDLEQVGEADYVMHAESIWIEVEGISITIYKNPADGMIGVAAYPKGKETEDSACLFAKTVEAMPDEEPECEDGSHWDESDEKPEPKLHLDIFDGADTLHISAFDIEDENWESNQLELRSSDYGDTEDELREKFQELLDKVEDGKIYGRVDNANYIELCAVPFDSEAYPMEVASKWCDAHSSNFSEAHRLPASILLSVLQNVLAQTGKYQLVIC